MGKRFLVSLVALVCVASPFATPASANSPQLWTDSSKTTLLRSVTTAPLNQPDSLELVNNGTLTFSGSITPVPVECTEVEFGTTLVKNLGTTIKEEKSGKLVEKEETRLALPWGVFEGDNCNAAGSEFHVPIYFDTNASGLGTAYITIGGVGPKYKFNVHNLKLSIHILPNPVIPEKWCTVEQTSSKLGIQGVLENSLGPFTEETPNNLNVQFTNAPLKGKCTTEGKEETVTGTATGNFYLETMSTTTDTAWVQ